MSYTDYKGTPIYYEVHGQGRPLVLLNGIMMSHASWSMFVPELSKHHQLILLDFPDQGQSGRMADFYSQDLPVEVVKTVLDHLKIEKAHLCGISYGGEIAQCFTLKYPQYVDKLLLFNTTSWTNPWLQEIGEGWILAAKTKSPQMFYHATIPIIYSPEFYTRNIQWMNNRKRILEPVFNEEFLTAMIRLTRSAEGFDVREQLKDITAKTLVVGSEQDFLTPLADQELIHGQIKNSSFFTIRDCGHASMYEKPNEFLSLIHGFLAIEKELTIV